MTLDEFNQLPVVMSFFPLTFESGRQKWMKFEVQCNDCDRTVPRERTRGLVDKHVITAGYRSVTSTSCQVIAHALCPDCEKLTTACYVLHEDMTLTGLHPETGQASRWNMRKLTAWGTLSVG